MIRKLPTMNICGDRFYVDIRMGGLRNDRSPYNVIGFADMEHITALQVPEPDKNPQAAFTSLRFFYDKLTKDQHHISHREETLPSKVEHIEVLHPFFLDPIRKHQESGMEDRHIATFYNFNELREHKARVIPKISIFDHEFFVDTLQGWFQHATNKANRIYFSQIRERKRMLYFDFNIKTGRVVTDPWEKAVHSGKIEVAVLPWLDQLDPVGYKRLNGAPVGFLQKEQQFRVPPIRRYRVIPYNENYGLPCRGRNL